MTARRSSTTSSPRDGNRRTGDRRLRRAELLGWRGTFRAVAVLAALAALVIARFTPVDVPDHGPSVRTELRAIGTRAGASALESSLGGLAALLIMAALRLTGPANRG
ncbi:hypothetical protein [Tsukamurella soli]|uniref:hypothetical protein n=1 Tax=Tsukamurella soli TaxID=644556 RepID=UPI0031E7ED64